MVKAFYQTLLNLKAEVQDYPVGVESNALVKKFRQKWKYDDSKPFIGKYSDEVGILSLPDVFYPQNLGKDKRVILFQTLYEGLIFTLSEILLRIWNRIKYLLEVSNQNREVTELQEKYEELFGQPLYPLNWGFSDVNEFIEYGLQTFSEELVGGVNCVQKGEVAETQIVEEKEDDNEVEEAMMDQGVDFWLALDEPLPSNYVFKLPYPIPFDI